VARELQRAGRGFYTISSAGHESNALVAMALRPTDPALLHYRSGGFYFARAQQVPGVDAGPRRAAGLMALADEPIAGGRHKVFGHPDLAIIPQTSTIASHLPRSVGLAIALHRAYRLGVACEWPADAVVVSSFGDASANHSTAVGGDQHRAEHRLPGAAGPDPVRLRGQRVGHLRCRPPAGGSRPRTAPGRDWTTRTPTGPTRSAPRRSSPRRCAPYARNAGRSSCT
jgi:hypothetical protein